jgi:5-(carboxyamino)imidazole ribonucleotide synthase
MIIGVVGGGQLARMMIPAAEALGIEMRVFAETEGSSARTATTMVGDYTDWETLLRFATDVDVLTFDHEHVPTDLLHRLEGEGVTVRPGPHALVFAQDNALMRERLSSLDVPLPRWVVARSIEDADAFIAVEGGEAIAKTPRGGYDGKGVKVVGSGLELVEWLEAGPVLMEQKVAFRRELAQLIARRPTGGTRVFPLVHTIQEGGVCAEVIAPAPGADDALITEASRIAHTIAESLDVTGVLAVEMFETEEGELVVNELAMRPHNSGHVFTEGAITSQFEQHLRAVADWPLGDVLLRDEWAVMVNLFSDAGDARVYAAIEHSPAVKVHAYGKEPRLGRKAGHLVVSGSDLTHVHQVARAAARAGEDAEEA